MACARRDAEPGAAALRPRLADGVEKSAGRERGVQAWDASRHQWERRVALAAEWLEPVPCRPDAAPSVERSSAAPEEVELRDAPQSEARALRSLKRPEALGEEPEAQEAV